MSQNKIFSEIIKELIPKYYIESKLIPTYRYIENDKYLYINNSIIDFNLYYVLIISYSL